MQIKKEEECQILYRSVSNGLVGLGLGAAVRPVNLAIIATCLRELVIRLRICHVLLDAVH